MQLNVTFGTIVSVNSENRTATVKLDSGQTSGKNYKYPKNCAPIIGDRILIFNNAIIAVY